MDIPEGANMVWVQQFYDHSEQIDGSCIITRIDQVSLRPSSKSIALPGG
jgi:hypothetical protein